MEYILLVIGGALGSFARLMLGRAISERKRTTFPAATFLINATGAFLLGIVNAFPGMGKSSYILFGDGFLGSYTTFSAFMYESFNLFRENKTLNAFIYMLCSFACGIAGFAAGFEMVKILADAL